jgi:hypothetical protein
MNILLIYPKFPDTFWSFRHALSFIGKKSAFPRISSLKWGRIDANPLQAKRVELLPIFHEMRTGNQVERQHHAKDF